MVPLSILFNKSKTLSLDFSFCLTTSDLNYLLHDENGMNDECMDFWWDKVQQASPELQETSDGLIFLCPSVMHLVSTLESIDDVEDALSDLNLSRKGLILMPINDHAETKCGGTHWALLCYIREQNQFRLYDTYRDHNLSVAVRVTNRISKIISADPGTDSERFLALIRFAGFHARSSY